MAEPQRPEAQDKPPLPDAALPSQEPRFDEAEFLRRIFDRSIQEMDRSRTYFEKLLKWTYMSVGSLIAVGIALFGFFWFKSWSDIQKQMEAELKKTKDAIVEEGKRTIAETEEDIRVKAAGIFKEENIRKIVRDVAKEKTGSELSGIIKQTVNDKVASQIKAEEPQIRNTVVSETKKAVKDLNPVISSEVKLQVEKKSSESLDPLRKEIKNYREISEVSALALLARNGNGRAYDKIQQIASSTKDTNIKEICISTVNQIYVDMNQGFYTGMKFTPEKTIEEYRKLLDDPGPLNRWASVDALAAKMDKSVVAKLIDISNHDDSMWVRKAAYQALKGLTGQKYENFQEDKWNEWWKQNKANWPPK